MGTHQKLRGDELLQPGGTKDPQRLMRLSRRRVAAAREPEYHRTREDERAEEKENFLHVIVSCV